MLPRPSSTIIARPVRRPLVGTTPITAPKTEPPSSRHCPQIYIANNMPLLMRSRLSQYIAQGVGSSGLVLLSSQPASPYCILVVPELVRIGYGLFRDAIIRFPPPGLP